MKISIVAVGRLKPGAERALFEDYIRRLREPVELIEVEEKRKSDTAARVAREGDLLLAKIPDGATMIALDGAGVALSSEGLAERLAAWREDGVGTLIFIIGGADGLPQTVLDRADLTLSLGAMTWPHMLARVMLAEQLFRAEMIAQNHPYHRAGPPPGRRQNP